MLQLIVYIPIHFESNPDFALIDEIDCENETLMANLNTLKNFYIRNISQSQVFCLDRLPKSIDKIWSTAKVIYYIFLHSSRINKRIFLIL